jgi:uncharacterized protein YbjT (DUF2867 family)
MAKSLSVLVTGATGQQGGALARSLLKRGHRVRTFSRKGDSSASNQLRRLGCEIAVGNFDDRSSLERAMWGMDCVFSMATPFTAEGPDGEIRHGRTVAAAIKRMGIRHLVYSSVANANKHTHIPHFESKLKVEEYIQSLGIHYTIVAPAFFMENFLSPDIISQLQNGSLALPLSPSRELSMIAVEDIADFVVFAMENRSDFIGKRFDVASDEVTGTQMAEILSRIMGFGIQYNQVPHETAQKELGSDLAQMFDWINQNGLDIPTQFLRNNYPEIRWHRFDQWAKDHDWGMVRKIAA